MLNQSFDSHLLCIKFCLDISGDIYATIKQAMFHSFFPVYKSIVACLEKLADVYLNVLIKKIEIERVNQEKRLVEFAGYITLASSQK